MSETFTFAGKEYEDSLQGAAEVQFDLMNIFDTDPYMFMYSVAYGSGIAYAGFRWVALVTGEAVPSFWTRVLARGYMTAQNLRAAAMFTYANAGPLALAGSAVAQRELWQMIGDEKTGAVHFASAGTMSGSMPMISSSDTSSPDGGLRKDFDRWLEQF